MPNNGANATVNKLTQFGPEATPGTGIAATKIVDSMSIEPAPMLNTKAYRAQGRKYPFASVPGREWADLKGAGVPSYQAMVYWLSSILGQVTPVTHTGGTTSKDWTFTSTMGGLAVATPQTYTIEKGDSQRAQKYSYGLWTDTGFKITRDANDQTLGGIAQQMQDPITPTAAGVTHLPEMPIKPGDWNFYLDVTPAGLGGTLVTDLLSVDLSAAGIYGPAFYLTRANNSFGKHVELAPKFSTTWGMETDAAGMSPLAYIRQNQTVYLRAQAQGPIIEGAINYLFQLDMVAKCTKIVAPADDAGVYKIGWQFDIAEDQSAVGALGYAWKALVTNVVAAL